MSENEARVATVVRETGESKIAVTVNLDGTGKVDIETPVGFLKHMLSQIARHGLIDLKVKADGDLETGSHHTVEDTAIVLGRAIDEALGDRKGIVRMADRTCPLDEALTRLEALDPELSKIVELRFFGGLTVKETVEVLGVSRATLLRGWHTAKSWLARELQGRR